MAAGCLCLFAVLAAQGRLGWFDRRDLPVILSVGLLQMFGFMAIAKVALVELSAGRAAILGYSTPLWVGPIALLVLSERLGTRRMAGLMVGLGGLAVLFNPFSFDWSSRDNLIGNGLMLLAALNWAIVIVHIRIHRWCQTVLQVAPWQMLVALIVLTPIVLLFEGVQPLTWSGELGWILLYNGPLATALAFWLNTSVNRRLPATTFSVSALAIPAVGLASSAWALGEPVPASQLVGFAFIGLGIILVVPAGRRQAA
jgi:drug/metabolite transporter (DMT)-like permease